MEKCFGWFSSNSIISAENNLKEEGEEMNKNLFGYLMLSFLLFSVLAGAEESGVGVDANFRFKTQHISAGGFAYDDPALVSMIGVNWKGFNAQFIHFGKTIAKGTESDQLDWCLGYAWNTTTIRKINWEIGWALEDAQEFFKNDEGEDFHDYFLEAAVPFEMINGKFTLLPFVKAEFYTPVDKGAGGSGGSYAHIGLKSVHNFEEGFSVNQRAAVLFDSGVYSKDSGQLLRYVGRIDWPLCSITTLAFPILELSLPLSSFSEEDSREAELSGGFSLNFTF